jgi:transcriptional regulator with XRE-family HTH domain
MPTWDTRAHRGTQRGQAMLRRVGDELYAARTAAGLSSRSVGALVGISHVQVIRIERGMAWHVDIEVLARLAAVLGHELSLRIHPIGAPVRDKAHLALLDRFAARLAPTIAWQTEVPIPLPGDLRSADLASRQPRETRSMRSLKPRLGWVTPRPRSGGCMQSSATSARREPSSSSLIRGTTAALSPRYRT